MRIILLTSYHFIYAYAIDKNCLLVFDIFYFILFHFYIYCNQDIFKWYNVKVNKMHDSMMYYRIIYRSYLIYA